VHPQGRHGQVPNNGRLSRIPPCISNLVLRDEDVLLFVKCASAAAPGSQWDVCSKFKVGMADDEEEEEP